MADFALSKQSERNKHINMTDRNLQFFQLKSGCSDSSLVAMYSLHGNFRLQRRVGPNFKFVVLIGT